MIGRASTPSLIGLALMVIFPSLSFFQKYLGNSAVIVYVILAGLLIIFGLPRISGFLKIHLSPPGAGILLAIAFLLLLVAFLLVYPWADAGGLYGGSDNDDALDLAASELLAGRYPYSLRTYYGNPVSPLPGSVLLAVPFVLLGASAYQNFFWLAILLLVSRLAWEDWLQPLLLLGAVFLFSPSAMNALLNGTDYLANGLYVLLPCIGLVVLASQKEPRPGWMLTLAAFLGIALSSRLNFLFILPLLFAALVRRCSWKWTIAYLGLTLFVFCAVTLPFYFYDPAGFTPLHTLTMLGDSASDFPLRGIIVAGLTGLLSLALAFRERGELREFLRHAAWILAIPVLAGVITSSLLLNHLYLLYTYFGLFFIFFGTLAYWPEPFHHPFNSVYYS